MTLQHLPELTPPEGVVQMVCTEFIDDPVQMDAYASFAARVDADLSVRGLAGWAALDVRAFLARYATSSADATTMCCMLATVLPWMVRAGDLSRRDALYLCAVALKVCSADADAAGYVDRRWAEIDEMPSFEVREWEGRERQSNVPR